MISVLILGGYSDPEMCIDSSVLDELCDIYIPLLKGILRYNGITCESIKPSSPEKLYSISGYTTDNLIYVPFFSCCDEKSSEVSFIYTDSTSNASISFRIASRLRNKREEVFKKVVFVNGLNDGHFLKKYSPVVVDNIRFSNTLGRCDNSENLYKFAATTAKCICDNFGIIFRDPSCA